jgi:hypothetical protein
MQVKGVLALEYDLEGIQPQYFIERTSDGKEKVL